MVTGGPEEGLEGLLTAMVSHLESGRTKALWEERWRGLQPPVVYGQMESLLSWTGRGQDRQLRPCSGFPVTAKSLGCFEVFSSATATFLSQPTAPGSVL